MLEYSWYCDQYSVDTISAGVVMSFLYESFERNLLTAEDTGGLKLTWGDKATALELLHQIAAGKRVCQSCGIRCALFERMDCRACCATPQAHQRSVMEELALYAMEAKGLEFSMYITKESLAQQGGYGFALKGPQHDESWLIAIDQLRKELPTLKQRQKRYCGFHCFAPGLTLQGCASSPG